MPPHLKNQKLGSNWRQRLIIIIARGFRGVPMWGGKGRKSKFRPGRCVPETILMNGIEQ